MQNDLLTNKKNAALLRDAEEEIAHHRVPPIDLRELPRSQWDTFLNREVVVPDWIPGYLSSGPPNAAEVQTLEAAVEEYHDVKSPFHISMSIIVQQTGRAWAFVPEAARYLTGFTLGKIDNRKSTIENSP